jgi:hypothetical protein
MAEYCSQNALLFSGLEINKFTWNIFFYPVAKDDFDKFTVTKLQKNIFEKVNVFLLIRQ